MDYLCLLYFHFDIWSGVELFQMFAIVHVDSIGLTCPSSPSTHRKICLHFFSINHAGEAIVQNAVWQTIVGKILHLILNM